MAKPTLTKTIVDALQARDRDYVTWCGKLAGFGVRTRPTGRKSYIAQYDFNGRTRKVTIGTHGAMTVDQARDKARAVLANAQLGVDEAETKARRRAEMTVAELCDEYLAEGCDKKKASTIATDKGRIARHIKPLLGTKKISDVARGDIERFMRAVATGKTAKVLTNEKGNRVAVTGGKGTATRTVRLLGGIFSYAVKHGYIDSSPRAGVQLYADGKGKRYLSPAEFQQLGDAMREAETVGLPWQFNEGVNEKHRPKKAENQREVISPHAIAAIRLLMLTGCRLRTFGFARSHDRHGNANLGTVSRKMGAGRLPRPHDRPGTWRRRYCGHRRAAFAGKRSRRCQQCFSAPARLACAGDAPQEEIRSPGRA